MTTTNPDSIMELLKIALTILAGQIPMLLAYLTALIIVIVRWREAPRASMLALCGILLGLFLAVVIPSLFAWLPRKLSAGSSSMTEVTRVFAVLGLAGSVAHAISFGFLFMAIYAGRRPPGGPARIDLERRVSATEQVRPAWPWSDWRVAFGISSVVVSP